MFIYETRWFHRWARKRGLSNDAIRRAVVEIAAGRFDADLGGGLFKKRIALAGRGKSGGLRTIVATNRRERWFFVYGFAKNDRANIEPNEHAALKKLASVLLNLSAADIDKALRSGALLEVDHDG